MKSFQRVVVIPDENIAEINPFLHGHFAEHLGELVYPGVYVGPESEIPNTRGIRNDVIEALKPLEIPVLRWPGGCFADTYHWRDGVGPREQRPTAINVHWGMAEEPNAFGTDEFMDFAQMIGSEPYFAANLGSGSPNEMRDWIEYCNFSGNSTLADARRTNGSKDPYRVKYWGIGNENWACGGNLLPEEYAQMFSRYRTYAYSYPDAPVEAIACGPSGADWNWTERFFATLGQNRLSLVQGFAAHYYCNTAGTATEYTEVQWLELLARAGAVEGIITGHRALMDVYDPERKIKLLLDEWGTWHPVEIGKPGGGLYQQNTMRDACVAALSLDIFHNQADKLFMANIAQVINVLQSVLLVEGDQVIKTPTYHVFDLYRPHKGAHAVRLISTSEVISDGGASAAHCRSCYRDNQPYGLRGIQGSASVKDGMLCVTAVNSHPTQDVELAVDITQGRLDSVEVVTLSADDIHAHNTFGNPNAVTLSAPTTVQAKAGELRVHMPAASVIRILGRIE